MLWTDGQMLMQLRDFRPEIDDPGQWGLFGGHLDPLEPAEAGLRRELGEEIGWTPGHLQALGHFDDHQHRIVGYAAALDVPINDLVLGEGCDFGAFTMAEVSSGMLFSGRHQQAFPLTAITRRAVALWSGIPVAANL